VFFCFANNPNWASSARQSPYTWAAIGGPADTQNYAIDNNDLYLYIYNANDTTSVTFEYRYFIFYNELI
jgi:hypothetical protein